MKFRLRKSRVSIADGAIVLWLVCWSGFDFVKAWQKHSPYTIGEAIFFVLAIALILIMPFELKPQGTSSEGGAGQEGDKGAKPSEK